MITLATLPQATAQQVFDQAKEHLLTQNAKCYLGPGQCAYRNSNNLKCAAGIFMSDEEYQGSFEERTWQELCDENEVPKAHKKLIIELQNIHDSFNPSLWKHRLKVLCFSEGLEWK